MTFTFEFVRLFGLGLVYTSPLLIALILFITLIGQGIGRQEGWSRADALYYSFVTATTVGYGDLCPTQNASKFWAVIIALLGVLLTGLVVALGLQAATAAFAEVNAEIVDKLSVPQ